MEHLDLSTPVNDIIVQPVSDFVYISKLLNNCYDIRRPAISYHACDKSPVNATLIEEKTFSTKEECQIYCDIKNFKFCDRNYLVLVSYQEFSKIFDIDCSHIIDSYVKPGKIFINSDQAFNDAELRYEELDR